ncbi:MAG: class I SAM-dependent methyltransferase [Bacteroidetes bacterium]|jgi:ubiquinone/menaquinone biosynthesis C-methylase UbiE|nr:class I SAM-dependent methyltransferase [Bacteroidota bacterium]
MNDKKMTASKNYIPALKYDWLTKVYDLVLQFTMPERKFKSALIRQMEIKPNDRILDFGCGSLTLSIMAAQRHPQAQFFGVDIDEKIIFIAKEKLSKTGLNIDVQQYDGNRLPYPDNSFDHVMSSLVFHHLTLKQKYFALEEIHRILKPSGQFHIADFGKPTSIFQRFGFYLVQLLDGFQTTTDNIQNLLSNAIKETFLELEETTHFKTMVGTVRLIKATKKNNAIL